MGQFALQVEASASASARASGCVIWNNQGANRPSHVFGQRSLRGGVRILRQEAQRVAMSRRASERMSAIESTEPQQVHQSRERSG